MGALEVEGHEGDAGAHPDHHRVRVQQRPQLLRGERQGRADPRHHGRADRGGRGTGTGGRTAVLIAHHRTTAPGRHSKCLLRPVGGTT